MKKLKQIFSVLWPVLLIPFILVPVLFASILVSAPEPIEYFPHDGIWTSKELELSLNFASDICLATSNGEVMQYDIETHENSPTLCVVDKEYAIIIFTGDIINFDTNFLILRQEGTHLQYTFTRQTNY